MTPVLEETTPRLGRRLGWERRRLYIVNCRLPTSVMPWGRRLDNIGDDSQTWETTPTEVESARELLILIICTVLLWGRRLGSVGSRLDNVSQDIQCCNLWGSRLWNSGVDSETAGVDSETLESARRHSFSLFTEFLKSILYFIIYQRT